MIQRVQSREKSEVWIRKPVASSQGRGIRVNEAKRLLELLGSRLQKKHFVIQKYISKPLLIDKKKFDVRIYVVVTSFTPLRIYMFNEGLARFCTSSYSRRKASRQNSFKHLTNYSINKKSQDFQHNVDSEQDNVGSKWSLTALYSYLTETFGVEATQKVQRNFEEIIVKTVIAADDEVTPAVLQQTKNSESCFELFGFDLLLGK